MLDLVDRVEGVDRRTGSDRRSLGDAGDLLDSRGARGVSPPRSRRCEPTPTRRSRPASSRRAEAVQDELDQLVANSPAAFGLGGRDRRAASAAERARLNVTRALRAAIAKLVEALPDGRAALDRHVRTGLYCAYEPAPTASCDGSFSPD